MFLISINDLMLSLSLSRDTGKGDKSPVDFMSTTIKLV